MQGKKPRNVLVLIKNYSVGIFLRSVFERGENTANNGGVREEEKKVLLKKYISYFLADKEGIFHFFDIIKPYFSYLFFFFFFIFFPFFLL